MDTFELEVKSKLKWSLKKWQEEGAQLGGFKRLVNSLKFWNSKLHSALKDMNVILTLYHETRRAYPSLQKIAEKLSELDKNIVIKGYAKFKNKRFLSLTFENLEIKHFVAENLLEIDGCKVAYLHWVDEALQHKIILDWLSDQTDLDLSINYIEQFMNVVSVKREQTLMDNGEKCFSGRVIFEGQFIDNISIEDIPYYGIIDNLECHLIIEGRASKCFICHKVGHKSVQCLKAYCKKCNLVLFKNHLCILHNGQSLVNNENIEISDSQVEAISENKNIACSNNLFQNLNLNFSNNVSNEIKSDNNLMEFTSTQSNLVTISEGKVRSDEKIDKWFTEGYKTENVFRNNNPYITEEVNSKDPNFILIDTSSEESDSEGEMNSNFMQQGDWCMTDMNKYAEVSRKLVQDSMIFLKQNTEAGNSLGMQLDKVSPSHVINKISIEDTEVKDICMQTGGRLQSDIEKGTIKKKRKQKRKHK